MFTAHRLKCDHQQNYQLFISLKLFWLSHVYICISDLKQLVKIYIIDTENLTNKCRPISQILKHLLL